ASRATLAPARLGRDGDLELAGGLIPRRVRGGAGHERGAAREGAPRRRHAHDGRSGIALVAGRHRKVHDLSGRTRPRIEHEDPGGARKRGRSRVAATLPASEEGVERIAGTPEGTSGEERRSGAGIEDL